MLLLDKERKRRKLSIFSGMSVTDIEQNYKEPAILLLDDTWITASCLRCSKQYCVKYVDKEISCPEFPDFSYERNLNVCPVGAISWDYDQEFPYIDNDICIGCGLCASRCPVGAIYEENGRMIVSEISNCFKDVSFSNQNLKIQRDQILELKSIAWKRKFQKGDQESLLKLYQSLEKYDSRSGVPNLLVRNLIIALGYNCALSRTGDVHTRMDAVYSGREKWNDVKGAIEIEFGRDTLDASRGILDDIAVLHSRANVDKNEDTALVVCLSFPNKRQGYFQVLKDIKEVFNIKIQTISLGALLLLMWNGALIDLRKKEFYVDFDNMSIREPMQFYLNRKININKGFRGILEPEK